MRINEVEKQVGITKKNIRFYEDQGLIHPERNKASGYRDYSEADVMLLFQIKLFRKLAIPIEEIRKMLSGKLTLTDCLERHRIYLDHEVRNLELVKMMCQNLSEQSAGLADLQAVPYLEELQEYEKGGNRFMNVTKVDVGKKKRGAAIAAGVMIALILLWDVLILILNAWDPAPPFFIAVMIIIPTLIIVGIVLALKERMKEIDGGEEDEAAKY